MKEIKKATDTSEVGSELMKILVQIREGIDHKKIYYTHNRYEEYFAKSTFRKLTEVFW
jgi:N-acetylglutamate synthase-like GNAT family acetyltransferase